MQSSIDLLSEKNKLFMVEMVELREENLKLCGEVALLREENKALRSACTGLFRCESFGFILPSSLRAKRRSCLMKENKGIRLGDLC